MGGVKAPITGKTAWNAGWVWGLSPVICATSPAQRSLKTHQLEGSSIKCTARLLSIYFSRHFIHFAVDTSTTVPFLMSDGF
jgi:hypothetical protein